MTDVRQQIASQLEAYHSLEALKAAVQDWITASDCSLDAFEKALEAHQEDDFSFTDEDWRELERQGLAFEGDADAVTRDEHMRRIQHYRETGEAVSHDKVVAWLDSWGTDNELPCPK